MKKQKPQKPFEMNGAGITNWEISKFLNMHKLKHFQGVYSCDNIPAHLVKSSRFHIICNLSKKGSTGSHFITIIYAHGTLLVLDSLGLHFTLHNHLLHFFTQLKIIHIIKNTNQLQNYNADTCGLYCIYFCLLFETTQTNKIEPFQNNCNLNDIICQKNIFRLSQTLQ